MSQPECDGRCVSATDLGMPEYEPSMQADPECSLHGDRAEPEPVTEHIELTASQIAERKA